jgi:plasmid stabilization system protein ParE
MELAFATRQLRSLCQDGEQAAGNLSRSLTTHLQSRLADLRAAGSVADLIAGRPMLVEGREAGVQLDLSAGYVLVCRVNHADPPRDAVGKIDWRRVRRLRIVAIEKGAAGD